MGVYTLEAKDYFQILCKLYIGIGKLYLVFKLFQPFTILFKYN